jgi:hypothetical protein
MRPSVTSGVDYGKKLTLSSQPRTRIRAGAG